MQSVLALQKQNIILWAIVHPVLCWEWTDWTWEAFGPEARVKCSPPSLLIFDAKFGVYSADFVFQPPEPLTHPAALNFLLIAYRARSYVAIGGRVMWVYSYADMHLWGDAAVRIWGYMVMFIHCWKIRGSKICDFMVFGNKKLSSEFLFSYATPVGI